MKVGQGEVRVTYFFVCNQGSLMAIARKTTSVCVQRLRLVPLYLSQYLICPFWPLWPPKVGQAPGMYYTHVKYTRDPSLVTAGQQIADIMQIEVFCVDLKTQ